MTIVLLNNEWLGMVRQWQNLFWDGRFSETDLRPDPDFVKVAESFGARGIHVERLSEVRETLERGISSNRTRLVDIRTDAKEDITPMTLPTRRSRSSWEDAPIEKPYGYGPECGDLAASGEPTAEP